MYAIATQPHSNNIAYRKIFGRPGGAPAPPTPSWLCVCVRVSILSANTTYLVFTIATCLCAGRGLTLVGSVIEGEFAGCNKQAEYMKQVVKDLIKKEKVKGFPEVIVSKNLADGLSYL